VALPSAPGDAYVRLWSEEVNLQAFNFLRKKKKVNETDLK
jgi:hypothetical protein